MGDTNRLDESEKQRLIVDYIGTVRRIAHGMARMLPRDVSVDDLIGAGLVGLADALAKNQSHTEAEFAAYVGCRVRGAITDELRRGNPLTRSRRKFERRREKAVRDLTAGRGRSPRESELAERMGVPIAQLREHVLASFHSITAFDPVSGAGVGGRQYPDETIEGADAHVERGELRKRLVAGVQTLPERMQEVLRLYYEQDYSLREIGEAIGVTESRVCQIHREALGQLRAACFDREGIESGAEIPYEPASGWV